MASLQTPVQSLPTVTPLTNTNAPPEALKPRGPYPCAISNVKEETKETKPVYKTREDFAALMNQEEHPRRNTDSQWNDWSYERKEPDTGYRYDDSWDRKDKWTSWSGSNWKGDWNGWNWKD